MKHYTAPPHQLRLIWPIFFLKNLILLAIFLLSHHEARSQECMPPDSCGTNPQLFCDEVTLFNWAIIPTGSGLYNIPVFSTNGPATQSTYYLMSGTTVVATLTGTSGVFQNISPGCYRIVVCVLGDIVDFYCCQDLPCAPEPTGCCELKYNFFTNLPNPTWDFDDMTTESTQNVMHEYTNVNTYSDQGIAEATITLSWGTKTYYSRLFLPPGIWVGQECEDEGNSDVIMNTLSPTLKIFPTLSYTDRQISIKGSITMNEDYQFTNSDFCMHPGSRIVSVANTLSFLSGTILHEAECKEEAWYGVDVREGKIVGYEAEFTGAYNAIRIPPNLQIIPALSIEKCLFNRNYLGINVASPIVFKPFAGNTFGTPSGMLSWPEFGSATCSWIETINRPQNPRPFAGIYATTPQGGPLVSINILTYNPQNLDPNLFVNLSNGIYLVDANAELHRCRFQNIIVGGYPGDDGVGIAFAHHSGLIRSLKQWGLGKTSQTLTFDNCLHAFRGQHGNLQLFSFNNNMNVGHGYTLEGCLFRNNSHIRANTINFTGGHGISTVNTAPESNLQITANQIIGNNAFGTGAYFVTSTPQSIGNNYAISVLNNNDNNQNDGIYSTDDGVTIANHSNILVENNTISDFGRFGIYNLATQEVDIRCNTVVSENGLEAIRSNNAPNTLIDYNQTDETGQGIAITGPGANSRISCNTIGSHDIGLFYDGAAITGNQLPDGTSAGNTWVGTYGTWAAQADLAVFAASRYFVRNGEINLNEVFPNSPPAWFDQVQNGITCQQGCPANQHAGRTETELDVRIATDSLNPGGLAGYLLKRTLFKDLLYYPTLIQGNMTLQNFHTTFSTTNGGRLVLIEKALADGLAIHSTLQTQWNTATAALDTVFEQLYVLDSLVLDGASLDSQLTVRQALLQSTVTNDSIMTAIYADNLNARIAAITGLQLMLDSITPVAQWETNEKRLNEIYLHTGFVNQNPDSIEIAEILDIAEQCSSDGGPVVFRARAWYYALTGIQLDIVCDSVQDRSHPDAEHALKTSAPLRIAPNPAQHEIRVWLPLNTPDGSVLEVYDMQGKLKAAVPVSATGAEGGNVVTIPVVGLSNGAYSCRLLHKNGTIYSTKFIIQR